MSEIAGDTWQLCESIHLTAVFAVPKPPLRALLQESAGVSATRPASHPPRPPSLPTTLWIHIPPSLRAELVTRSHDTARNIIKPKLAYSIFLLFKVCTLRYYLIRAEKSSHRKV